MHTVQINTENTGSSYEEFESKFLEICNTNRNENKALVFAFILYDFNNPQIAKILNDPHYWLSLDEISGHYLTVFSLHYKAEDLMQKKMELMRAKMNSIPSKEMNSIITNLNPSSQTNQLIKKYFGDNIDVKYPSVLFFQVNSDEVVAQRLIQLDENAIENSFEELKNYIKVAAEALHLVNFENKHNTKDLFNLVDTDVRGLRDKILFKKGFDKVTKVGELVSTVAGLG